MRKLLPVYAFAAILPAIVLLGLVERRDPELQGDINRRQAEAVVRFIESRLEQGVPEWEVLAELNEMPAGADADRRFAGVISQDSLEFFSHPMVEKVGQPVASAGRQLSDVKSKGRMSAFRPLEKIRIS